MFSFLFTETNLPIKWVICISEKNAETSHELLQFTAKPAFYFICSASLERTFTTFGNTWTKLRNRLGPENAEKLIKVYYFLEVIDLIGRLEFH
jgi:hypothetical protein